MKPKTHDRKNQDTIRFYIEEELKIKIKIYALENKTTIQELYDVATNDLLKKIDGGK